MEGDVAKVGTGGMNKGKVVMFVTELAMVDVMRLYKSDDVKLGLQGIVKGVVPFAKLELFCQLYLPFGPGGDMGLPSQLSAGSDFDRLQRAWY